MMEIIPAIDIMDGKCVRLTQGNYNRCKIYSENPLEVAQAFEEAGITRLHLVDLDGAKASGVVNIKVLENICRRTGLSVDFGGGIKSDQDLEMVLAAGADYVCVGSMAQADPEKTMKWLDKNGGERIIIGSDVWNGKICIQGWKKVTDMTIFQLLDLYQGKIRNLMCTDITRDGMMGGPAADLYTQLLGRYPEIHLIASGGVKDVHDLERLKSIGISAVVVGKAIYEKKIKLEELKNGQL